MRRTSVDTVRWAYTLVGILLGGSAGGFARADVPAADKTLSTALFQQAKALMEVGQTHAACEKFAESQRLDPGGGTLLNLARCHEVEGRTGTAWVEFNDALAWSHRDGRPDREAFAREHIAALEPRLARIQIDVPESSQADGLDVRRDGTSLGRPAWGSLFPLDPGLHVLEASAPGHLAWRTQIEVLAGQSRAVTVPPLVLTASDSDTPAPVIKRHDAPSSSSGKAIRTVGFIVGAAGVSAVGVGTYFGLHARYLQSRSNANCIGTRCSPEGAGYEDSARKAADLSTVVLIVGAAAIATGGALAIFAPRTHRGVGVGLVASGAGVAVVGVYP